MERASRSSRQMDRSERGLRLRSVSGRRRQCLLEQLSNFVIAGRARNNLVPFQNTPRVSVHYKGRVIAGIQQNRVRRLRPYPIEREQFVAEFARWAREHPGQRPAVTLIEKAHKRFQPLRLLSEVTRRANQLLKFRLRRAPDSADRQKPRFPKVAERPLNVCPRSVLRQVGPDNYFEARLRRPPVLSSPGGKQRVVVSADRFVSGLGHGT